MAEYYDETRKADERCLGEALDWLLGQLPREDFGNVFEPGIGNGRIAIPLAQRGYRVTGMDISGEMLRSARAKLGARAQLAQADACTFDGMQSFGTAQFDRIILSYAISMIPDWQAALATAARHLAPGGQLHVVDFGNQSGLPGWFRRGLLGWLAKFHVTPRGDLAEVLAEIGARQHCAVSYSQRLRGYAQHAVLTKTRKMTG